MEKMISDSVTFGMGYGIALGSFSQGLRAGLIWLAISMVMSLILSIFR